MGRAIAEKKRSRGAEWPSTHQCNIHKSHIFQKFHLLHSLTYLSPSYLPPPHSPSAHPPLRSSIVLHLSSSPRALLYALLFLFLFILFLLVCVCADLVEKRCVSCEEVCMWESKSEARRQEARKEVWESTVGREVTKKVCVWESGKEVKPKRSVWKRGVRECEKARVARLEGRRAAEEQEGETWGARKEVVARGEVPSFLFFLFFSGGGELEAHWLWQLEVLVAITRELHAPPIRVLFSYIYIYIYTFSFSFFFVIYVLFTFIFVWFCLCCYI
jgi:hypothetical protein